MLPTSKTNAEDKKPVAKLWCSEIHPTKTGPTTCPRAKKMRKNVICLAHKGSGKLKRINAVVAALADMQQLPKSIAEK